MNIYNSTDKIPAFQNAVITIGTFDGVHNGHVQIIQQLVAEAKAISGTPIVITFYPHPRKVLQPSGKGVMELNTPDEKFALLHKNGIEHIVIVPFNEVFANMSAHSFIQDFIVHHFHPHTIIIGYDHRFGKNREGNYQLLLKEADKFGFRVKEIPEQIIQNNTISSTKIRASLLSGNIQAANSLLGYSYFFSGTVVKGNQKGRTIDFPTANLEPTSTLKLIPNHGVYAVKVKIEGSETINIGMMNIGCRPTVNGTKQVIEVNIFDFDDDLYGKKITVAIEDKLRDERKFENLDLLKKQLQKDRDTVKKLLINSTSF